MRFSDTLNEVLNTGLRIGLIQHYCVENGKLVVSYHYIEDTLEVLLSRPDFDSLATVAISGAIIGFTSAKLAQQHLESTRRV